MKNSLPSFLVLLLAAFVLLSYLHVFGIPAKSATGIGFAEMTMFSVSVATLLVTSIALYIAMKEFALQRDIKRLGQIREDISFESEMTALTNKIRERYIRHQLNRLQKTFGGAPSVSSESVANVLANVERLTLAFHSLYRAEEISGLEDSLYLIEHHFAAMHQANDEQKELLELFQTFFIKLARRWYRLRQEFPGEKSAAEYRALERGLAKSLEKVIGLREANFREQYR